MCIFVFLSIKEHVLAKRPVSSVFLAYVMAGGCEELIKLIIYIIPLCVVKDLRTVYDLIFLSIVTGCSFATIENLLIATEGISIGLCRFVWCTLTHATDCAVGASILGYMKSGLWPDKWWMYPLIWIVPVLLHGTYDYVLFLSRDLKIEWISYLSIVVGFFSLFLFGISMYSFRRLASSVSTALTVPTSSCLNYSYPPIYPLFIYFDFL